MHVFVSYSRRDAAFVRRVVSRLEAAGHDVWVDTDDIRGSEEWRASIVGAIRRADVVVLVVSHHSMESENVGREITVASEEDRRILPIVFEPVGLTGSLRYELAGVQQLSFAGRPFEEAAAELVSTLGPAGEAAPAPATAGANAAAWAGRRALFVAGVIAVVVAGMWALARGSNGDDAQSGVAVEDGAPRGSGVPSDASLTSVSLDVEVWFAGYEIAVAGATYDPAIGEVAVDVTLTNVQPTTADPYGIILDDVTVLEWNGRRFPASCSCNRLPPGAALPTPLTAVPVCFSVPPARGQYRVIVTATDVQNNPRVVSFTL